MNITILRYAWNKIYNFLNFFFPFLEMQRDNNNGVNVPQLKFQVLIKIKPELSNKKKKKIHQTNLNMAYVHM